jgi:hypothetical protein
MDPERLTPSEYVTAACVVAVVLGLGCSLDAPICTMSIEPASELCAV